MKLRAAPLPPWHPAALIATWFGCGFLPWAPGSWGSLAALPFAWLIAWAGGALGLLAAAAALFLLGWWAASVMANSLSAKDPACIVVDEVVGQWLTLAAAPLDPIAYALGFLLFRFCDVVKPWPVRWADREIGGGLGIMLDDALAGLMAAVVLLVGRAILGR
ncbi:MAG TPA: phosphatidylglycerophosphatase A [Stellaceae bacterium]|nr:phosphatidylglycerophosphatase A [Stellaceae bacterium]